MQPLRVSRLETVLSTTSSFICTYVASFPVLPFVGVPVTHGQNLMLNLVLLAIQVARHLFWRRLFVSIWATPRLEPRAGKYPTPTCRDGVQRHPISGFPLP